MCELYRGYGTYLPREPQGIAVNRAAGSPVFREAASIGGAEPEGGRGSAGLPVLLKHFLLPGE